MLCFVCVRICETIEEAFEHLGLRTLDLICKQSLGRTTNIANEAFGSCVVGGAI